ncbi:hypothetical protein RP20_CCG014409 [Aedes albopictus]|nr:hypothetical protein RP20_CCG014409 [Aedes albopictus]
MYQRKCYKDCRLRFHVLIDSDVVSPARGKPAFLKEFAHMGAIGWTQDDGKVLWHCGGTLIWIDYVLTAAHCVVDHRNIRPDIVRFGDLNLETDEDDEYAQQYKIAQIYRHPLHRFGVKYHDIALIKLEQPIRLHDTVCPACLWIDPDIRFTEFIATGWGSTVEDRTPSLLKVSLKPMESSKCEMFYTSELIRGLSSGLHENHLCAVDEEMDTCEVRIFDNSTKYICMGAIISDRTILTSASCVNTAASLFVQPLGNSEISFQVRRIVQHSSFNTTDYSNDIAILRLPQSLIWSPGLHPVCLWNDQTHSPLIVEMLQPFNTTYITDIEYIEDIEDTEIIEDTEYIENIEDTEYIEYIENIEYIELLTMYNSDCQRTHAYRVRDSHICVKYPYREYTCLSSHSMLRWKDAGVVPYLIGLSTDTRECMGWSYMIFSRVAAFIDWIVDNIDFEEIKRSFNV